MNFAVLLGTLLLAIVVKATTPRRRHQNKKIVQADDPAFKREAAIVEEAPAGPNEWFKCQYKGKPCKNGWSYGCHKGSCWRQCNGLATKAAIGPEVVKEGLGEYSRIEILKEANVFGGISKEWCLSSGDSSENIPCKVLQKRLKVLAFSLFAGIAFFVDIAHWVLDHLLWNHVYHILKDK